MTVTQRLYNTEGTDIETGNGNRSVRTSPKRCSSSWEAIAIRER